MNSGKMKILVINGPNLNLLGIRETEIYGNQNFEIFFKELSTFFAGVELEYYQSNIEGEIINKLHEAGFTFDGIVLNAGGYTHTSVAIGDAIKAITTPVTEVHISNIQAREDIRCRSMISAGVKGIISGFGLEGYRMAIGNFVHDAQGA
jgi:3-dehydroquinate dehydratase II